MKLPEISIIIPIFDNFFLNKTLKSVLNQTYKNYEVIIVNDNPKIVDLSYSKICKNKKIKIINNLKNFGPAKSRHIGINKARGKYIAFLDSDDVWKKDKLKLQLRYMKKNNLVITFTNYEIIDEFDKTIYRIRVKDKFFDYKKYLIKRGIVNSSVIIKKELLTDDITKSTNRRYAEDTLWWLKLMKKNITIHNFEKYLVKYRISSTGLSSNFFFKIKNVYGLYRNDLKICVMKTIYIFINLFIYKFNFIRLRSKNRN